MRAGVSGFDGIRVLVVRLGDAFPFVTELHEQEVIGEIDPSTPSFLEDADDGMCEWGDRHRDLRQ